MRTLGCALICLLALGAASDAGQAPPSKGAADAEQLARDIEDVVALNADYDSQGILPQQIQELKDLLERTYPDTADGAALKARVYVELARVYMRQEISPMAIQLLQDGIADLSRYPDAELALRQELVDVYRSLGFAPQAIRENKRIRQLRARLARKDA